MEADHVHFLSSTPFRTFERDGKMMLAVLDWSRVWRATSILQIGWCTRTVWSASEFVIGFQPVPVGSVSCAGWHRSWF